MVSGVCSFNQASFTAAAGGSYRKERVIATLDLPDLTKFNRAVFTVSGGDLNMSEIQKCFLTASSKHSREAKVSHNYQHPNGV